MCFGFLKSASDTAGYDLDVNNDGKVDEKDIIAVATGSKKIKKKRRTGARAAGGTAGGSSVLDLNGDGKVDYKDAQAAVAMARNKKRRGKTRAGPGSTGAGATTTKTTEFVPPDVMASTCTGRKRALFIGINYTGSDAALRGCINDVKNMKNCLSRRFGFEDIRVITDEAGSQDVPTRDNIMDGFHWLVQGARTGDSLFLHYSGHGGSTADKSGLEADGNAETVVPLDFKTAGQIIDDDIHKILCQNLPEGVRLTAIFDSCHSGSVLDLPYLYTVDGNLAVQEVDIRAIVMQHASGLLKAIVSGNKQRAMSAGLTFAKALYEAKKGDSDQEAQKRAEKLRKTNADVIQFSGCRDEQTSADANEVVGGRKQATGALSWALIKTLEESGSQQLTYTELLGRIRTHLHGKYSQVPQLTAGRKVNLNTPFIM